MSTPDGLVQVAWGGCLIAGCPDSQAVLLSRPLRGRAQRQMPGHSRRAGYNTPVWFQATRVRGSAGFSTTNRKRDNRRLSASPAAVVRKRCRCPGHTPRASAQRRARCRSRNPKVAQAVSVALEAIRSASSAASSGPAPPRRPCAQTVVCAQFAVRRSLKLGSCAQTTCQRACIGKRFVQ